MLGCLSGIDFADPALPINQLDSKTLNSALSYLQFSQWKDINNFWNVLVSVFHSEVGDDRLPTLQRLGLFPLTLNSNAPSSILKRPFFKPGFPSCAYEMCGSAPGMPAAKRENAKTRKPNTKTRKRENAKTKHENAKTGKRENAQIEHVPRSTWNTNVITALGMCKVCTEAVHSVALGTRTLSQLWACVKMCKVCTEAVHSVALWTRRLSQLWACVKYVPKQSIP